MTGMGSETLNVHANSVSHQFYSVVAIELLVMLVLGGLLAAGVLLRRRRIAAGPSSPSTEPVARRILRVGFGVLWLIAGLLQLQPDMPLGLPISIVSPAAVQAPGWMQALISPFTAAWLRHPVIGASAVIWLQVGLGIWMLAVPSGRASQVVGGISAAWGLGIWVLGNALGGLFAPNVSWMFGAPGAPIYYVAAGVLLALPPQTLTKPVVLRRLAQSFGALLGVLALVQAWPGQGFWSGGTSAHPGQIPSMASAMGAVKQPPLLASLQSHLASFASHGSWLINGVVVLGLALCAVGMLTGSTRAIGWATQGYVVLAMIDWIAIQDLGIFGGLATDVNSMVPSLLLPVAAWAGLLVAEQAPAGMVVPQRVGRRGSGRVVALSAAVVLVVGGAAPLVALTVLPGASADAASAAGPGVATVELPASEIVLTDQHDQPFTLSSFQGHRVILTFLDPACSSDCPIEAQQMHAASDQLGAKSGTIFVAVNTNAKVNAPSSLRAFDTQQGLTNWPNWYFVTGTAAQLAAVWKQWGVEVQVAPNGSMVIHSEPFFAIDSGGTVRSTWNAVTGQGPASALGASGTALIVRQARALS